MAGCYMERVILSAFFEGTANHLKPVTTQIGLFFEQCNAIDISDDLSGFEADVGSYKMGFDGCGVVAGVAGMIWAFGLSGQCQQVCNRVNDLLAQLPPTCSLIINVLGLSRGGIAALMLAEALTDHLDETLRNRIELNLCLFDPVPGNLVCTSRFLQIVPVGITTANSTMDVTRCGSMLRRCLAIYPFEALPAISFHAPLLASFPPTTELEEDSTLGCHQGAFYPPWRVHHFPPTYRACVVSYLRVHAFLSRCGTPLPPPTMESAHWWDGEPGTVVPANTLPSACLSIMNMELAVGAEPSSRVAHQAKHAGHIVRHAAGRYLNRHHLQLELEVAAAASGNSGVAKVSHVDLSGIGKDAHDQRPLFTLEVVRCPESSADAVREAADRADEAAIIEAILGSTSTTGTGTGTGTDTGTGTGCRALHATREDARLTNGAPACVPHWPRVLRLSGLPIHLSGWNGEYRLVSSYGSGGADLRNGRPTWRREPHTHLFVSILGVSVWFNGVRWVLQRDGDPDEGPFALLSCHANRTPLGPWTHGQWAFDGRDVNWSSGSSSEPPILAVMSMF